MEAVEPPPMDTVMRISRMITAPYAALLLVLAGGCHNLVDPGAAREPLTELPRALTATEQTAVQASNRFAFQLLREVLPTDDGPNTFLSPFSASMALGMAMNGATGATLDEMRATLGFGSAPVAGINAAYRGLYDLLPALDRATELRIANSIWSDRTFPFHASFLDAGRTHFDARVEALDFRSPQAVPTINRWVSESTRGRIPTIIERIDPDEVMFLINAVHFKGSWETPFPADRTQPAEFRRRDGTTSTVPMMNRSEGGLHFFSEAEVEVGELRYGRGAYAMTIVMPRSGTVEELVASLDEQRWSRWTDELRESRHHVSLPRFQLEYEVELAEPLQEMGMRLAFGRDADFSPMSPRGEDLAISRVVQKTFVAVDEVGTEAAAATAVGISVVSMPPTFRVDRPFLVAIRERFSGTILFLGVIGDPAAG